jgi:mono/diheme cytochrome c family protein
MIYTTKLLLLLALACGAEAAGDSVAEYRDTLNRYCVTCHNEKLRTASLMLDLTNVSEPGEAPHIWERVITKLSLKAMPPVGMPRPDDEFYAGFAAYLKTNLDTLAAESPNPGRTVTAHRLNRYEYANVINDLLGVEIDSAALLPADNSGGFDNLGDLLSVSEVLMEKYMSAARKISQQAVGALDIPVDVQQYTIDPRLLQNERMSEDLPFGSRGGLAVRHRFPLDGDYELSVRLLRTNDTGFVIGLEEPKRLDVRLDGERVKLFTLGGENVGLAFGAGLADNLPPDPEQAQYERSADSHLHVRFPVQAGARTVQVAFLDDSFAWEAPMPRLSYANYNESRIAESYERAWAEPGVSSITVTGPYDVRGPGDTLSRQKIFVCTPTTANEEEACASKILTRLTGFAYRRQVDDADIAPLLELYRQGRRQEDSFDGGIQMAIEGLLVSTEFLFRIERDPDVAPGTIYAVNDIELASRLSFFLWSSIPDDELLTLAKNGQLREPGVLEQQVTRMLEDARAESLVSSFAEQWLLLRNLPKIHKDQEIFPEFDETLRNAMYEEVRLFIRSMFREDRSVLDFLRAEHTYLNERLAKHYGIEGVYGSRFQRVTVPKDQQGLLARAGILSITSYPTRNSTVLRGKWVLENILAAPPPPPPAVIPPLEDTEASGEVLTLREKMEIHPANPVCAVCHNQMDPIGFGLENYGAIGQWRTLDNGKPINSAGRLPNGIEFQGPAELQAALLDDPRIFASAFTQKLLTYALGRPVEYYDMPVVRKIVEEAAATDYRFSSIVLSTVTSVPFQMRRAGT